MNYYVSKTAAALLLLFSSAMALFAASQYPPASGMCWLNSGSALALAVLSGALMFSGARLQATAAIARLTAQIDELAAETKPSTPSLGAFYEAMLTQARFHLDVANAKVGHREWQAAEHSANMGMQNIRNYREAAAAKEADQ